LNSVDLQGIRANEFSTIGDIESFRLDLNHYSNPSDAAVYGGLRLQLVSSNTVRYVGGADFGFEMQSGFSAATIFRNIETFLAGLAIGAGQPFVIDLAGTARIE